MKFFVASLTSLFYIFVLLAVYFVHIRFFTVDVVFYSAILDSLIAVLIAVGLGWLAPLIRTTLSAFERTLLVCIWLLGGYAFAISVPTVVDRSLSMYILEKLAQRGGGIELNAMQTVFTEEYVREHRLVDVRITEQLESGTITLENGCVKLTEKGQNIASMSRWFRMNLLPKQRLLMGEYSDDLTDPFKSSQGGYQYECQ